MISGIITTVVAALLLAGIFNWIKSRRLYLIAPRLYFNTTLSDGQIVSLTLYNAGFLPEEDVALTLRSGCKFELLGTSKSTLALKKNTLSLPKLARHESVTVLLLFEDVKFGEADIESLESKNSTGIVVDSKEQTAQVGQGFTICAALLLSLALPFLAGTFVGSEMGVPFWSYAVEKLELTGESKQLAGYTIESHDRLGIGALDGAFTRGEIKTDVEDIVRRGDVLYVKYKIVNNSRGVLTAAARFDGMAGTGSLSYTEGKIDGFGLAAGQGKSTTVKVYKPADSDVQIIKINLTFGNARADYLYVEQVISLK